MASHRSSRPQPASLTGRIASYIITAVAVALAFGSASSVIAAELVSVPVIGGHPTEGNEHAQDDASTHDTDADGLTDRFEVTRYGTNPAHPDSDRDGITDGDEVLIHRSNPLNPDSDADSVTDGEEIRFGTGLLATDSDGDDLADGAEVALGTDPFASDSDKDGLVDGDEVRAFGSSPIATDTDRDGLLDGDEVTTFFTNPAKPDAQRVYSYTPLDQIPTTATGTKHVQAIEPADLTNRVVGTRVPTATSQTTPILLALD